MSSSDEKIAFTDAHADPEQLKGEISDDNEALEVFQKDGQVDFRNVGWKRATTIFLKIIFATGVLGIPSAMSSLGAVGGALSLIGWGALNTYNGKIQGDFRNRHRGCHSIADMAEKVGGFWLKEVVGVLFIIAWVLCAGAGILGLSIAFNVFSGHATCTVWFTFVSAILVAIAASVRRFHEMGYLTMAGFLSIFAAVFIVVVGVTTLDRPAAAPQTGDFELGFYVVGTTTFSLGMVATCTIFVSSAGTSAFLPVISEMREPKDFHKALYTTMGFVTAAYLSFALVVYYYCGSWVASPSLGSAGDTIKIVAYAVGFIGLWISGALYLHVGAKYLFVRILRKSKHLQANTLVHWGTWLGCTAGLTAVAFILASAIPIFNYLVSLTGSVCFGPLAIILPGYFYCWDHMHYMRGSIGKKIIFWLHALEIPLGAFICIAGTYGVIMEVIGAYAAGTIGTTMPPNNNPPSSEADKKGKGVKFDPFPKSTASVADEWLKQIKSDDQVKADERAREAKRKAREKGKAI